MQQYYIIQYVVLFCGDDQHIENENYIWTRVGILGCIKESQHVGRGGGRGAMIFATAPNV